MGRQLPWPMAPYSQGWLLRRSPVAFEGANMVKAFSVACIFALAGCSGVPAYQYTASPCFASEASYECQIERYQNVNH